MSGETGYIKCLNCGEEEKADFKAAPMMDWIVDESKFISYKSDDMFMIECTSCDNKNTINETGGNPEDLYAGTIDELNGWEFSSNLAEKIAQSIKRNLS